MTITAHPLALDFGADFAELGAFLAANPAITRRMRSARHVNIPLAGGTTDERLADLHAVAREMGTAVEWAGGMFVARVRFGGVTLEAHHAPTAFLDVPGTALAPAAEGTEAA